MYRLFCNDRLLISKNFSEDVFLGKNETKISTLNVDNVIVKIKNWLNDISQECLNLGDEDGDVIAMALRSVFRQAPAAGGVVMIDNQFVAIERNGIPDLPKGHIEKGETPEVAAVREVEEETGIGNLEIIKELPSTWHCYLLNEQWTIKKTAWFLMKTASGMQNVPQIEEGISKVYLINIDGEAIEEFKNKTFASIREMINLSFFR